MYFFTLTFSYACTLHNRVDTMMFAKFLEECIQRSDDEVLFFEESIISKMNRSSTVRTKLPTPFLDDMRYDIV
jgi:hypothetical protein